MARRFEQYYKTHRLDNLGDPDWHDRRWQDIDLRMANRENDSQRIDDAVDRLEAVALARLNDTFSPIIQLALDQLADIGISFNGQSLTNETVGSGTKTFIITEQYRSAFVVVDYVSIRPSGHLDIGMICSVTSYNRLTGALVVEPIPGYITGASVVPFTDWTIRVSITPNLDTYTRAEIDATIAGLVNGAPTNLNTLGKIAGAMGGASDTLLFRSNNLSDVSSPTAARGNLGLGSVDNTPDNAKPLSTPQRGAVLAILETANFAGCLITNKQRQSANYTLPVGSNAMSTGPITIDAGVAVTIPTDGRWVVI